MSRRMPSSWETAEHNSFNSAAVSASMRLAASGLVSLTVTTDLSR